MRRQGGGKGCVLRCPVPPTGKSPRQGFTASSRDLLSQAVQGWESPLVSGNHLLRFGEREGPPLRPQKEEGAPGPGN